MPRFHQPTYESAAARQALHRQANRIYRAALSSSTRRTYRASVIQYRRFCAQIHRPAFPVSRTTLQLYATHWVSTGRKHTSFPSVRSALKDYSMRHDHRWLFDSVRVNTWWKTFMRGLQRAYPHQPKQKAPLTADLIKQIIRNTRRQDGDNLQLITMTILAHDGLLRAAELCKLRVSDISQTASGFSISIRRAKNNKTGPPQILTLGAQGKHSAARYLRKYLRSIPNRHASSRLFSQSRRRWIKFLHTKLAELGLDPTKYSGHSMRSGGATDLWQARVRPRIIQSYGRWLSDAFWRYIRINPTASAARVARAFEKRMSSKT